MAQNLHINILAKDRTKQALGAVQAGLGRLKGAVFSIQSALLGVGGALVIRSLTKVGSEVENLKIRFAFLFKGMEEGNKAFDELIGFAAKVPFSLEEISTASGNLAVVSKDAEDLAKVLEVTGNVAVVTGLDFRQTAEQIQRAFAGGIAAADVFRERGVRSLLGFEAGAKKTAKETKEAFFKTFGPDGEFGKAMEVMATTFTGTLSMLSDKLFKFKLDTDQAGFFDFVKNALAVINQVIERNTATMQKMAEVSGRTMVAFIKQAILGGAALMDLLAPVFKGVALGISGLMDIVKALPPGIREVGILGFFMFGRVGKILIVSIFGLLKYLGVDLDKITNKIFGTARVTAEWGKHTKTVQKFIEMIEKNMVVSQEQLKKLLGKIKGAEEETKKWSISMFSIAEIIQEQLKKGLDSINQTIAKEIVGGIKSWSKGMAEVLVLGKDIGETMRAIAQRFVVNIVAKAIELVALWALELALKKAGLLVEDDTLKTAETLLKVNTTDMAVTAVKLGLEKQITKEKEAQAMLSGNPLGFLSFFGFGKQHGGAVSKGKPIVVGERGPELFLPNTTGQITQNARGTGGGPVNVNFSITTLDASGFSEMLVQNRGTISNIINQAVNERGASNIV